MLNNLHVTNIPAHLSHSLDLPVQSSAFVLKTCQRTLFVQENNPVQFDHAEYFHGLEAYLYLLETICGLKSRLVGENDIVNQFKEAYQTYMASNEKSSLVIQILEKLFQDAKDIRTKHLIGIGQKSYATIARRQLIGQKKANTVLITGSGLLAEDMINQLKKKCQVMITGRNKDKVEALAMKHGLEIVDWKNKDAFKIFPHIVNTIGTTEILFSEKFFYEWFSSTSDSRLFIDLGSPSALATSFAKDQGVLRLEDIFEEGAIRDEEKLAKIRDARNYIDVVVNKRSETFNQKRLQSQSFSSVQA
jgi:glutamyl-tRNA reductase